MEFWVLWILSFILVICTRITINKFTKNKQRLELYKQNKKMRIVLNFLISTCIIVTGGIIVAKWVAGNIVCGVSSSNTLGGKIFDYILVIVFTLCGCALTYCLGYVILGLHRLEMKNAQEIICLVLFIVSIIGWTIPMVNYNRNIETKTETVIEQREEREVIYFCNIPVQKISGSFSGSSILGSGSMSGAIDTTDNLPYWYVNENEEALFDSAPAKNAKIRSIKEDETPHVEIIHYATKTTTTNKNNGNKEVVTDKTWTQYIFYMPEEIMEFNLKLG